VFNPASHARSEVIPLPGRGLQLVTVEACGWAPAAAQDALGVDVCDDGFDNGLVRVRWDDDGLLTEVWDHEHQRDVLAAGRRGNVFQLHDDHPNAFDAWDVDPTYRDRMVDLVDSERIEVVQTDPLRASLRVERNFGSSRITQLMHVTAGSRRIEFETEVDWQESHRFLKVMFPVAIRSSRATFGIQHGYVERPTVANTSWDAARFEVCAHRWADLSEAGYGVALLNESKYGYDIRGNELRLSLLRAPSYPDPTADRGTHSFGYALFPHGGDLQVVIEEAEAFNLPLTVVRGSSRGRVLEVDRSGVSVEAVKMADRERAVVVRLCEVRGARGPVTLNPGFPIAGATRTDLLERDVEPLDVRDGSVHLSLRPFELVTVKLALGAQGLQP
jgi:alpha-mannosidase